MKILTIQDDLFSYLQHVVRTYAQSGIDPEEGLALYHLNQAIKGSQSIDENKVASVKTGALGGIPVTVVEAQDASTS